MKFTYSFLISMFFVLSAFSQTSTAQPKVGDSYIDFSLPYATKDSVAENDLKISDIVGKRNVVLAFYPADWSGGCTKEVCTLRDNFDDLSKLDAEVLPISGDYPYSHREWAKFHNLQFKLLSDHKHEVAKKYVSYGEDNGYNKRTVFVIDKKGKIAYIDLKYSTRTQDSFTQLQDALKKLK